MRLAVAFLIAMLAGGECAQGQTQTGQTQAGQTQPGQPATDSGHSDDTRTVGGYVNFFAGPAASTGNSADKATLTGGVTLGEYFARTVGQRVVPSLQLELGAVGPLPGGHALDGLASINW